MFLNEAGLICLYTVKWFQVFLRKNKNLTSVISFAHIWIDTHDM